MKKRIKIIGSESELNPEVLEAELIQLQPEQVLEPEETSYSVELQLGDVIRIKDPTDSSLDNQTFLIDYIDPSKIHLVNTETLKPLTVRIPNKSITEIALLSRALYPGYARQNDFIPGNWIRIFFVGEKEQPTLIGEIKDLEEDLIEVELYPEKQTIYLNFNYQGLPEDLSIEKIEVIAPPLMELPKATELTELPEVKEEEPSIELKKEIPIQTLYEEQRPAFQVKNQIREVILDANQIVFGKETLGAITQYVDVSESRQRYSIEVQLNDLLDDLLSTVPSYERTPTLLNQIHIMLERYQQLRSEYSSFDEYGNVNGKIKRTAESKPLTQYLEKFDRVLYWILPVVQNVKKIYNVQPLAHTDVTNEDIVLNLESLEETINQYRHNNYPEEQNKYEIFLKSINPYFTPFESLDAENSSTLIDKHVAANLNIIKNNLMDFYSSSVAENKISSKRFFLDKYTTGMTKLETLPNRSVSGIGMSLTNRVEITESDILSIQSILTLPEPIVHFSQIDLPKTSIMDRANLNLNYLNYWQLLQKNTHIKNVEIDQWNDDDEEEVTKEENLFLKEVIQYSLSDELQTDPNLTREEKYKRFIQRVVPKTRVLFQLIRKYIQGSLSLENVVQKLEPFLISTKDITYQQYIRMTRFIYDRIRAYTRTFAERSSVFSSLKRNKRIDFYENNQDSKTNVLLNLLTDLTLVLEQGESMETNKEKIPLKKEVIDLYSISPQAVSSSLETLRTIMMKDSGRFYFSGLSLKLLDLMFPDDLATLMEQDKIDYAEEGKEEGKENKGKCADVVIAKMYSTEEDLLLDNDREVYFDQKYDTTDYGLLEKYEGLMIQMSSEDFLSFLIGELEKKLRLTKDEASILADTLITGFKMVVDGQYAVIHQSTPEGEYRFIYYLRKNNRWVLDKELTEKGIQTDDGDVLCNLEKSCISIPNPVNSSEGSYCEPVEVNKFQLKENLVKNILGQFDEQYETSKKNLQIILTKDFLYYQDILPRWNFIEQMLWLKPNQQKYLIGLKIEKEGEATTHTRLVSPYAKLRDLILGQQDFVKKQGDIVRFSQMYTREAYTDITGPLGEKESIHWLYCLETNTKLLPNFLNTLASAWLNNPSEYLSTMDQLIKEIGALSDDGDSWVDKYSGYVICKEDYSTDEGFDEGYRVSTRAVLEEDVEDKIRNALLENGVGISDKERRLVQNTPEMRMINNIINAICTAMGISLESDKEWMIGEVSTLLKNTVPKESVYQTQVLEMSKKGKTIPSFKELCNTLLLYYTLGILLIGIQTRIPSIRTRRTFPGCIRSFTGYPLEGAGDLSSIQYLACIAYKIRSSAEPWSVLLKKKEGIIATTLKDTVDKHIIGLDITKRKIQEKMEYLLMDDEGRGVEEEYDIRRWTGFLPPLVPFQVKGLQPVSTEFEKTLLQELKSGSSLQRDKIGVMEGKVILFSLAIQQRINEIVQKKDVVLRKMTNEPYLENACCNERSGEESRITCLAYFEKEDSTIAQYNQIVGRLINVFQDIFFYSSAPLLYSPFNTKNIYPPVDEKFSERTIYQAFIKFCHLASLQPIPTDLVPLCVDKPEKGLLKTGDNLTEMIAKLKNDGRNFTYENFLRLLQIYSRNRIINMELEPSLVSGIQHMRDVIEIIEDQPDEREKEKEFVKLLELLLDTYDLDKEKSKIEVRNLNNYLSKSVDSMKRGLTDFLTKNKSENMTKNRLRNIVKTIQTMNLWEIGEGSDSKNIYRILEVYKESIDNFINVFPSIIQHRVQYQNVQLPSYWGLSPRHKSDVVKIVGDYYQGLREFYDAASLRVILAEIPAHLETIELLSEKTPCFSSVTDKEGKPVVPIFDERTSKMLFEYYFLKVFKMYMDLTDDDAMIVVENRGLSEKGASVNNNTYNEQVLNEPIYTTDFVEEVQTNLDTLDETNSWQNTTLFIGNMRELKQKTCDLLACYLEIFQKQKETIDVPYQKIQDRVFQLKQKEKDSITDRLKSFTDEQRDVDTLLKINKLGEWGKGLQKGLTVYVKENYDEEREFMEQMMQYERDFSRVRRSGQLEGENLEDYLEQKGRDEDAEKEAYDISNMTEDYMDGYEPDGFEEEENYEDYQ